MVRKKAVIITGASSGIGRATAVELSKRDDVELFLIARNREKLARTQDLLLSEGHHLLAFDVGKTAEIAALCEEIVGKNSAVTAFVHCAGHSNSEKFHKITPEIADGYFHVHVGAFMEFTRVLTMKRERSCPLSVVGISSITADMPYPFKTMYAGCKAAIEIMSRTLAAELWRFNTRINCIRFGSVDTEAYDVYRKAYNTQAEFEQMIIDYGQKAGIIPVTEAAETVARLAMDCPAHMTGEVITFSSAILHK